MFENSKLTGAFMKSRQAGMSDEKIRQDALLAGWNDTEITSAFVSISKTTNSVAPQPSPVPDSPQIDLSHASLQQPVQTTTQSISTSYEESVPTIQTMPTQAPLQNSQQPIVQPQSQQIYQTTQTPIQPSPQVQNMQTFLKQNEFSQSAKQITGHKSKVGLYIGLILFISILLGGSAYAYFKNIGPFQKAPYTESNLLSGLLIKISQIESSSYGVMFELYAQEREEDAQPFTFEIKEDTELKAKYTRDSKRVEDAKNILSAMNYNFVNKIPNSLNEVVKTDTYFGSKISIVDPLTQTQYKYTSTNGGKDFELQITFETKDAIAAIESSDKYTEKTTTQIKDKTVTFTKDSYSYFYFSPEPPEPFLKTMSEFIAFLPPEIDVDGSAYLTMGKSSETSTTDWKFGIDGNGDFGDLSYKVNVEFVKKMDEYYARINNMPSLFASFLPPKGQWIIFSSDTSTSTDEFGYNSFISAEEISEYENKYKENKKDGIDFIKKITKLADEEKIFIFKNKPIKENIGERTLYRYDLQIRKDAILPFYKKMTEIASQYENSDIAEEFVVDEGYIEYLESEDFSKIFEYYEKNTNITLWVDQKGFPAQFKYSLRIVPPDTAQLLKEKQILFDFTLKVDDINTPVEIETPQGAKSYEDAMSSVKQEI